MCKHTINSSMNLSSGELKSIRNFVSAEQKIGQCFFIMSVSIGIIDKMNAADLLCM